MTKLDMYTVTKLDIYTVYFDTLHTIDFTINFVPAQKHGRV